MDIIINCTLSNINKLLIIDICLFLLIIFRMNDRMLENYIYFNAYIDLNY